MNEKQRLEGQQVNTANSADKKSEKDYSKYFQSVYIPPNLKEAKRRGKKKSNIIKTLIFPKNLKVWVTDENFISVHTAVK